MRRKILMLLLVLTLVFALAACGCKHEWEDADCDDPETCALCGETRGEEEGHDWEDADCTTPKTCSECEKTKGKALGHKWSEASCTEAAVCSVCEAVDGEPAGHDWSQASCTEAAVCSVCGETDGEPAGHDWQEATTESPKTCLKCGDTEGQRIMVDFRFTTASTKDFYGTWTATYSMTDTDLYGTNYGFQIDYVYTYAFDNKGNYSASAMVKDTETFINMCIVVEIDLIYQQMESQYGYDKSATDALYVSQTGKNVEENVKEYYANYDVEQAFANAAVNGVYYVSGDQIYFSASGSWNDTFEAVVFQWIRETVVFESDALPNGGLVLNRVS